MDPQKIVPEKLTMSEVRDLAEKFRSEHIFNDSIPVDIERIIESTMGIYIIPVKGLKHDCDMEGYISRNFKSIYLDEELYMDERYYKRVRFTIAHEIGHLVLHRSSIDLVRFISDDDWKAFRLNLLDEPLRWFEAQASEFAGRLLVPLDRLIDAFKGSREGIIKKNISWDSPKIEDEDLLSEVASRIAPKFGVSTEVIERRLRKENVMSLIGK
jgi:Zn-dependent peptidase ImmA (M78 family)